MAQTILLKSQNSAMENRTMTTALVFTVRTLAGLSQSELAKLADVPLRTIQQYEQRQKDINKAQATTLLHFSRVLNCKMEDLLEKVPLE